MSLKHAIVDYRLSEKALGKLHELVDSVHLFSAKGLSYEAIEGHPDIFLHQSDCGLVIAPNTPVQTIDYLNQIKASYLMGKREVGSTLHESTPYNCIAGDNYLFHKTAHTDEVIQLLNYRKQKINLPQAYTRCSMFYLGNKRVITSDKGIEKSLKKKGFECCYVNPINIQLFPYKNGFLGGCMGQLNENLVFSGSLQHLEDEDKLRTFIKESGLAIIELSDEPLLDVGGLFFIC